MSPDMGAGCPTYETRPTTARTQILALSASLLMIFASCASHVSTTTPLQERVSRQTDVSWWVLAAEQAEADRLARCPRLVRGCFVGGSTCRVTRCFCPRVCLDGRSVGPLWQTRPEQPCVCQP